MDKLYEVSFKLISGQQQTVELPVSDAEILSDIDLRTAIARNLWQHLKPDEVELLMPGKNETRYSEYYLERAGVEIFKFTALSKHG